jgi:arylformamidase
MVLDVGAKERLLRLSHTLSNSTPTYGRYDPVEIKAIGNMQCGDLCNSTSIRTSTHAGTHVDVAKHFIKDGRSIDQFAAEEWIFRKVCIVEVDIGPSGRHISAADIEAVASIDAQCDCLLLRTGFEAWRFEDRYIDDNPGLDESFARVLLDQYPTIRAVGMDFLSVCRFPDPGPGVLAHQILLSRPGMILIEDLSLAAIPRGCTRIEELIVAPLIIAGGDGGPATVFARL